MVAGVVLCRKVFQCLVETIHFRALFEHLLGVQLVQGPVLAGCTAHPLPPSPPSSPAQSVPLVLSLCGVISHPFPSLLLSLPSPLLQLEGA